MESLKVVQLDFGFEDEPVLPKKKMVKPNKKQSKDFVFDFMDCLTSPIIVFKSAWQNSIPPEILGNIKISRLLCAMKQEQMASLTETLAYMMPRTFEAPMPTEWVNIYTWLGLQYAMQFKKKEQLKAMTEIAPKELSDYELGLLNHLRQWLYEKRRVTLKTILKKVEKSKSDDLPELQESLFKE